MIQRNVAGMAFCDYPEQRHISILAPEEVLLPQFRGQGLGVNVPYAVLIAIAGEKMSLDALGELKRRSEGDMSDIGRALPIEDAQKQIAPKQQPKVVGADAGIMKHIPSAEELLAAELQARRQRNGDRG